MIEYPASLGIDRKSYPLPTLQTRRSYQNRSHAREPWKDLPDFGISLRDNWNHSM
jgi:hypothetical protein